MTWWPEMMMDGWMDGWMRKAGVKKKCIAAAGGLRDALVSVASATPRVVVVFVVLDHEEFLLLTLRPSIDCQLGL